MPVAALVIRARKNGANDTSFAPQTYTTARLCWWAPAEAPLTKQPALQATIVGNITDTSEFRG